MGDTSVRRGASKASASEEGLGAAQLRVESAVLAHAKARAAGSHAPTPAARKALGAAELELELAAIHLKQIVSRAEGKSAE